MDDIYFSDKRKREEKEKTDAQDKYLETDYFDEEFSLDFKKSKGNAQSFISSETDDEESFEPFAYDDSPSVQEVRPVRRPIPSKELYSSRGASQAAGSASPVRQISPRPVSQRPVPQRPSGAPVRRAVPSNSPAGSPSRTPSGRRVAPQGASRASGQAPRRSTKKKSNKNKIILAAVLAVILLIGGVAGWALFTFDSIIGQVSYDDTIIDDRFLSSDAPVSDDVRNILLIGSDVRNDGSVKGQRSDTMIMLSIDSAHKQIKLTSFLRDSYVEIPYTDDGVNKVYKSKMNAAYGKGGAQGVIDSIEYNFGVDVHNYASVDFETFEKIVDLMGGVTVDGVTAKEAKFMNAEADTNITEGSNHMNGYEALWYCRIRKLDSDFYRTMRQRKVLSAIINKAKGMKYTELLNLVKQVLPDVSTDLTEGDIKSLGLSAVTDYLGYEIVQQQIPADGTWRDGRANGSYVIDFDLGANKEILRDFVYNKVEETTKASE